MSAWERHQDYLVSTFLRTHSPAYRVHSKQLTIHVTALVVQVAVGHSGPKFDWWAFVWTAISSGSHRDVLGHGEKVGSAEWFRPPSNLRRPVCFLTPVYD